MREPLRIMLEFARADQAGDPFAVRPGPQTYVCRGARGSFESSRLDWDAPLLAALAAIQRPRPDAAVLAWLGDRVRAFLAPLEWKTQEDEIAQAVRAGRRVVVSLRSAAAELYALPWELLSIKATGQHLGELPGVLVRYEWPETRTTPPYVEPLPAGGRVLFAWSAAGGPVPVREHLQVLRDAARDGGHVFEPERDTLPHVSYAGLYAALESARKADAPIAVLHLLCHGVATGGTYGLAWNDGSPAGEHTVVDGGRLRKLLGPHADMLQAVVVCACLGGASGELGNHLGSVAQTIHRAGVRAVVASRFPLSVPGSVRFASVLYRRQLAEIESLETAFLAARAALGQEPDSLDWASVQLYAREEDGDDTRPVVVRPFRGLQAFQPEHSHLFFGRDAERDAICASLGWLRSEGRPRFLVVAGASGTGKSSVVLAAAIPRLKAEQPGARVAVIRPGGDLAAVLDGALGAPEGPPAILVVDQLEEIFTRTADPAVRQAFVRTLWSRSAGPDAIDVILTIRIDFLGMCGDIQVDDQGLRLDRIAFDDAHRVFIAQLGVEGLRAAIEAPARLAGLELQEGLSAQILEDVEGEPGALPLVQYALDELWERREGRRLTTRAYLAIGGAVGALHTRADALVGAMAEARQQEVRRLLVGLTGIGNNGGPDVRRRLRVADLRPSRPENRAALDASLAALVEARLLVLTEESGVPMVEVAHEALIRKWERLRTWIDEDRDRLAGLRELEAWVAQWRAFKALLAGDQLVFARRVTERYPYDVSTEAEQLLRESEESRARMREAAEAMERERQARAVRERRRDRIIGAGLGLLTVVAAVFAVRAHYAEQDAQLQQRHAEAERSAARDEALAASDATHTAVAERLLHDDPALAQSVLREVTSYATSGAWAQAALDSLAWPAQIDRQKAFGLSSETDISSNGAWLLTADPDGSARVRSTADATDVVVLPGDGTPLTAAFVTDDGRLAVTGESDGTAQVWWLREPTPRHVTYGTPTDEPIQQIAITPDATHLVAIGAHTVRLWPVDAPARQVVLGPTSGTLRSLAVSPDGGRVATAADDGTVRLWQVDDPARGVVLRHTAPLAQVVFAADGARLVAAAADGVAVVWPVAGGAPERRLAGSHVALASARFSEDGEQVITASVDGTARLWSLAGAPSPVTFAASDGPLLDARFSPNGKRFLTVAARGESRVWRTGPLDAPLYSFGGAYHQPVMGVFDGTGDEVVTVSAHGSSRIWAVGIPHEPAVFGRDRPVRTALLTPSGDGVLLVDADGGVRVRAADGSDTVRTIAAPRFGVTVAALSPDGKTVATGSGDGSVRLWDLGGLGAPIALRGGASAVTVVGFGADRVLAGYADGTVRVWHADGKGAPVVLQGHVGAIRTAVVSPDACCVLSLAADGTARVWPLDGPAPLAVLRGPGDRALTVAVYSVEGDRLLTGSSDGVITLRAVAPGGAVPIAPDRVLPGQGHAVTAAVFVPGRQAYVTGSADQMVRYYRVSGVDSEDPVVCAGHHGTVLDLAVLPDGEFASASADQTAQIWRLVDGGGCDALALVGHTGTVDRVLLGADHSHALTVSTADGTARLWLIDPTLLYQALWAHSPYCLPERDRVQLLGIDSKRAVEGLARCQEHVRALAPATVAARALPESP